MITPMSRVTVAALSASKEETLNSLRNWGLLHILPLQTPENEQVIAAKAAFANAQKVLEALPAKANATEIVDEHNLLSKISEILQSKKEAEEALVLSSAELKRLEPFGDFDPHSIRKLLKRNINVKLYRAEEKAYKGAKGFVVQEFKRAKGEVVFAVIGENQIDLPYTEIALPSKSIQELKKDKSGAEKTIAECEKKLAAFASKRKNVGELVLQASDELAFKAADASMRSEI